MLSLGDITEQHVMVIDIQIFTCSNVLYHIELFIGENVYITIS